MTPRLWLTLLLLFLYTPTLHSANHSPYTNRILDRIANFIASNASNESKAKLLGVIMNVTETNPHSTTALKTITAPTEVVKDLTTKATNENLIEPIDQLLMNAAEPGTAFNEPELLRDTDVVKFDGDILMQIEQFSKMQRNVTLDLFEEALQKNLGQRQNNLTLLGWIKSLMPLSRKKRAARRDMRRLWKDGIVPIRIDSDDFRRKQRRRIAKSMNRISENTCICFDIISKAEAMAHKPHIRIINGNGCRSYVGYSVRWNNGYLAQDLTLGQKCRKTRITTHELLHALGLFHEQSRPDRDGFVDIQIQNIIPRNRGNFNRFSNSIINSRGIPYDFTSIMHYSNRAFSLNGGYTIVPKGSSNRAKYLNKIGRSRSMSRGDKLAINFMYKCPRRPPKTTPKCPHYPYVFR
ncbi:zinc metalloproteinase nas-15-like [Pecten maximus]|uniref:zinc metalloproteinase nas-15-like n=1 Tax=Pecten maximus TaxID=6579 RepID=UPI001457E8A2|nr:zinc metalloproteinase nas-15-like [Pecten maximus]